MLKESHQSFRVNKSIGFLQVILLKNNTMIYIFGMINNWKPTLCQLFEVIRILRFPVGESVSLSGVVNLEGTCEGTGTT